MHRACHPASLSLTASPPGCMCYDGTYSQACCEGFLLNLPPPAPAAAAPAPGAMGPSPSYGWSTPWPSTYGSGGVIAADGAVPVAAATYGGGVEGPQAVALAMGEGDVSAKLSVVRQANGYASVADSYTLSQVRRRAVAMPSPYGRDRFPRRLPSCAFMYLHASCNSVRAASQVRCGRASNVAVHARARSTP